MVAVKEASPEATTRTARAPKVRAILAGGLVLGIGAAVTLAAWNDSDFAKGTFSAGVFNLQGSTNGTAFQENPAGTPATLDFTLNPENLAPGDTVVAPFAVRLDGTSTNGASVTVSTETSDGNLTGLTYSLTRSTNFGCTEPITSTLVSAQPLGSTPADVAFTLSQGAEADEAGAPANLCFRVTAGPALVQSQTGSTTWEFAAESR
ncbi:SipW-dependent-type signal peptide-containing protein [Pseudarthrobacter siccitolerans]